MQQSPSKAEQNAALINKSRRVIGGNEDRLSCQQTKWSSDNQMPAWGSRLGVHQKADD